jgi:hypothetical protein
MMKKMVVLAVLLLVAVTQAAPIAVENYSFELPAAGKIKGWNAEVGADIPGWASDGQAIDSGVESDWPGSTEGVYSGYLMGGDPSVWNLTGYVVAAGDVFTLQVDSRNNWSAATPAQLELSLYYDVAGVRNQAASVIVDLTDSWAGYSLTFTADDLAASIGNPIGIELKNAASSSSWIGIDNVRLDVIPEPATLSLLGLGVVALLRKRK